MKSISSIRRIIPTSSVLLSLSLLAGSVCAHAEGTNAVASHGKSLELQPNFEGTPTSYTRRNKDIFSVGYYIKDGAIVKKNSLLANEDRAVSQLDLEVTANGEGFNSVIATGKGTSLTLTGSISASDSGEGKSASDFSGLGAQL